MKTKDLIKGRKVVSLTACPFAGHIVSYSTLSGKSSNIQRNNSVKIKKLDGLYAWVTADLLKPYKEIKR